MMIYDHELLRLQTLLVERFVGKDEEMEADDNHAPSSSSSASSAAQSGASSTSRVTYQVSVNVQFSNSRMTLFW